ncbi:MULTISPECIES: hypothetical protein [Streptomyces]|uniref:hypothetical protein n=1 Tax=Streptomyces TaxID=1883 RepID=UPI001FCCA274|nr:MULTISPECIES: hypothetical protein [Streptomyces]MCL7496358.1 hypothetical protein [Streptomyces sp. MCA2]
MGGTYFATGVRNGANVLHFRDRSAVRNESNRVNGAEGSCGAIHAEFEWAMKTKNAFP